MIDHLDFQTGLRSCRECLTSAIRVSWLGEAVEEQSAVCGPYEAFGDFRVAFIVDLEATVGHCPCPGSLDNPTSREDNELVWMDPVDDFHGDVACPTIGGEHVLEPGINPQLAEPISFGLSGVEHGDPADVVRCRSDQNTDPDEQTERVNKPEYFASRDLLPGVVSPGHAVTVGAPRTLRASMIPADGSGSRPSVARTSSRSRSQTRSQVPSRDQVT